MRLKVGLEMLATRLSTGLLPGGLRCSFKRSFYIITSRRLVSPMYCLYYSLSLFSEEQLSLIAKIRRSADVRLYNSISVD